MLLFGQGLLNCHIRVTGRVIVMQRPVVLPFLRPFSPNTFAQTRQSVNIENNSNTCPRRYKFEIHYSFIIEKMPTVEDIKENPDARLRPIKKEDFCQCYNN
jgi:hypothetical protein